MSASESKKGTIPSTVNEGFMYRSTAATLLFGGELAGCTVGPNYARPAVDAPAAWRTPSETTASLADMTWWALFQDPAIRRKRENATAPADALVPIQGGSGDAPGHP